MAESENSLTPVRGLHALYTDLVFSELSLKKWGSLRRSYWRGRGPEWRDLQGQRQSTAEQSLQQEDSDIQVTIVKGDSKLYSW